MVFSASNFNIILCLSQILLLKKFKNTIIYSLNGSSWTNLGTSQNEAPSINDIIYYANSSNFYTVLDSGYLGSCLNCSSSNINWTTSNINEANNNSLRGIVFGNSIIIVVGSSGTILTSSDGKNWTSRDSGTGNSLYGVSYSQ